MTKNQNSCGIDIKNWEFQLKSAEGGSRDKKMQKIGPLTVDQAVDRFVGAGNLKSPLRVISLTVLFHSLKTLQIPASRYHFGLDFGLIEGFGVDFRTHLS